MTASALTKAKQKDLDERIGGSFENQFERAHAYFNLLKDLPEAEQLLALEQMLTKTNHPDTKKSGKRYNVAGISEVDKEAFKRGLGKLIDGHFQYQLSSRPGAADLAKAMWDVIKGFKADEEKIFGIGWLIIDRVVPYLQIPHGGVRLNDDTFKAMVEQLHSKIRMIDAILKWPELQGTEMMSLCLGVIMDGTTIEERAVLLHAVVKQKQHEIVRAMESRQ